MARPRKEGLDYFPMDVHLDYKWDAVFAMHGGAGCWACLQIMQECYKTASGELDISGVIRRKTIEVKTKLVEESLDNVLNTATEVGLFDKNLWETAKILTSNGIKKRIDAVSKDRKNARKRSETSYSPEKPPENTANNPRESTQSIVKYSKGENSKEEDNKKCPKKFSDSSHSLRLAKLLDEEISKHNDGYKRCTEASLQNWAKDVDRMIRLDKRTPEAIGAMIRAISDDEGNERFAWRNNILSAQKLRRRWNEGKLVKYLKQSVENIPEKERRVLEAVRVCTDDEFFDCYGYCKPCTPREAGLKLGIDDDAEKRERIASGIRVCTDKEFFESYQCTKAEAKEKWGIR